jgi:hypothetical protein
MACDVFYTIGKLLKHKCLKWACIAHLNISNTSYGQKKDNLTPDQKKSRIDLIYLAADNVRHIVEKFSMIATTLL